MGRLFWSRPNLAIGLQTCPFGNRLLVSVTVVYLLYIYKDIKVSLCLKVLVTHLTIGQVTHVHV
jgi:hypothetical protein